MTEEELFVEALVIQGSARAAYLDEHCRGKPDLRKRLDALLRAHDNPDSFLEAPSNTSTLDAQPSDDAGTVIGPYKVLQQIGEGGMGTVYMAEQTEPVRRKVALKVIKPGMDSGQVNARFEAERQALAMMDHVNIARVFDGGATDSGRPYFVMELVHGVPITKYCDDNRLTPRERLELFVPVCNAIQHAHQKGIIHRDIKPSNVMVTLYDGRPVPKVIDFGVAKAMEQRLTERTLFTQYGTMVGTLEYMSPEQAEMSALGVDTRSDIYSLGVLLYELLTGTTPLSHKRLQEGAFAEILRVIKEEEPPRPSNRLSSSGDALASISANRHMEPGKLAKLVRGELDWIVMRALEKDRGRRYETANGFATDVQRYLADEQVLACPPSTRYRLAKFVRRNKRAVLSASLLILSLIVGILGTTIGLWRTERARDDAVKAQEAEAAQRRTADEERAVAQAVSEFVQKDLLGQVDVENQTRSPDFEGSPDPDIKVRTVLDRAAKTIGARFANQPREEAAIRLTIANAYAALGNWPEARIHAERSVELLTATRGADHADTLTSNNVLAELLFFQYEVKRAVALFEEVVRRRTATLGPDHPDTLASKDRLAFVYQQDGSADGPDRAAVLLQEVVEKRTVLLGPNNLGTLYSKASLAWVYQKQGKLELAEAMYVELLKVFTDKFGADRPSTVHIRMNLGLIYLIGEKLDQAEPHLLSVLQKAKSLYGEDHYRTAVTKSYVARLYRKQRKYDHAARLYEEILAKSKAKPGANDQFAPLVLGELALTHLEAKKLDKALPLIGEIVSGQGHQPVAEIPQFAGLLERIGLQLVEHEQYLQAENLLGRSLAIREKKVPDDWSTFSTKSALGAALMGQKQYDKAEPLLFDGYHGMRQREDKIPTTVRKNRLVDALDRLVQLYDNWNKPDEAAKWRKELDFRKSSDKK